MTTIHQVLTQCAAACPDGLSEQDKARWLMELDGRIYTEVTGADEPDNLPVTQWPEQGDAPLLAQAPYQGLYGLWLQANVEFALGNYTVYNELVGRFEGLYAAFRAHWRKNHRPVGAGSVSL